MVAGGSPPDPRAAGRIADRFPGSRSGPAATQPAPPPPIVIAADRGFDHAVALGLRVDVLIGDLDSITPDSIVRARADGIVVDQHPTDKDATDLELALDRAASHGDEVTVLIGSGPDDRLDHLAAQFGLLASPLYAPVRLDAWIGGTHIVVVHGPGSRTLDVSPGELVTLLPIGGAAVGVRTTGLRFPLHGETLDPFATRGVSNEATATTAGSPAVTVVAVTVVLERGVLLIIRPNALEGHP